MLTRVRAGPAEDVAVADDLASLKAAISRHNSQLSQTKGGPMAPTADLDEFIEEYHGSIEEVIRGNPEPQKKFWSRADDATLANPLGPPGRGWQEISQRLDHACSLLRDGEAYSVDRVSAYSTEEVAWIVEVEHCRVKVAGAEEHSPSSLRATTIFRREDGEWKIAHRHADPITGARSPESLIQK